MSARGAQPQARLDAAAAHQLGGLPAGGVDLRGGGQSGQALERLQGAFGHLQVEGVELGQATMGGHRHEVVGVLLGLPGGRAADQLATCLAGGRATCLPGAGAGHGRLVLAGRGRLGPTARAAQQMAGSATAPTAGASVASAPA